MTSFATDARDPQAAGGRAERRRCPARRSRSSSRCACTPDGELFREGDGASSPYAPGHGDLTFALRQLRRAVALHREGGKLLYMSNVDNLAATLDPAVIGAHLESGATITAEVVSKDPGDAGGAPARVDGVLQIVESFRFPADFDEASIPVFNVNSFVLDANAIDRDFPLSWFVVRKKVGGQEAIQFEHLVGELTAFAADAVPARRSRGPDGRFQPVKDPEELARRAPRIEAMLRASRRALRRTGASAGSVASVRGVAAGRAPVSARACAVASAANHAVCSSQRERAVFDEWLAKSCSSDLRRVLVRTRPALYVASSMRTGCTRSALRARKAEPLRCRWLGRALRRRLRRARGRRWLALRVRAARGCRPGNAAAVSAVRARRDSALTSARASARSALRQPWRGARRAHARRSCRGSGRTPPLAARSLVRRARPIRGSRVLSDADWYSKRAASSRTATHKRRDCWAESQSAAATARAACESDRDSGTARPVAAAHGGRVRTTRCPEPAPRRSVPGGSWLAFRDGAKTGRKTGLYLARISRRAPARAKRCAWGAPTGRAAGARARASAAWSPPRPAHLRATISWVWCRRDRELHRRLAASSNFTRIAASSRRWRGLSGDQRYCCSSPSAARSSAAARRYADVRFALCT